MLIDYILENNSTAKIGFAYQDDDYGENALLGCVEAEEKYGITVQKESFQRGATDFMGQTMNFMKGGITDVIIGGIVREPVIIMKTAQAIGYKAQFYGLGPTVDPRVGLLAGEASEGFTAVYWAYHPDSDHPGPALYRELCEKYNGSPNCSYLSTNIGDTTTKQIAIHAKYFKNSLGVFLKFLKRIIVATNNMIMPCHLIHQSNPIVKNDKYE